MSNEWMDRLSDYIDGEMTPAERALVEARLAEDAELAATLESLRRVVTQARALDDAVPPRVQQMWQGVAKRIGVSAPEGAMPAIGPHRRRWWPTGRLSVSVPQLLAAGIALVLLSGGGAMLLRGPASPLDDAVVPEGVTPPGASGVATSFAVDAAFASVGATRLEHAVADLATVLEREREFLDPGTVRIVEENLAIIDQAIERSLRALAADPESEYLRVHLERAMRHKLTLLQSVTAISSAL